ncbi:hypothetical protein FLL45_20360 [Aliikangiella marina]|uniref:Uncharacterized protein n=1 Tax=Aliikangiella marina TaxID=1712262 RepID=A0A545T2Q5_9GAMM|nr:hypothetical protein [Aliikangiella marina]TQV71507.1 hypothetical protein FLL45_20360 [Aliikangiella marina]
MSSNITERFGFQPAGKQIASRKGLQRVADVDPRLTRSHYFDNRLLTEKDLNRDQLYLDNRLREVGKALGYGVLNGLETAFDSLDGTIQVSPGVAISEAGRVLELTKSLSLDLGDRASLTGLNHGGARRLKRGLYAIVVEYSEQATDIAEVFPTDLGETRGFNYDLVTEGVQLSISRLPIPFARQNSLQIRANLAARFFGDSGLTGIIPDDSVALGVIAIANDRIQWLDSTLLRQPLRASAQPGDAQMDLYEQYQNLFDDVIAYRQSGSLSTDFPASEYFRLLPPVGSLPKSALDPVTGRQSYFPENYTVSISPVRKSELNLILQESMVLPPLDLALDEPQDIVVLAPLNNQDYGHLAQRLERPLNVDNRKLPHLDLLRLRLYPRRPVHELNTDESAWQAIWDIVEEDDLIFVRRPQRTAETRVSGIVLAQGFSLPSTIPEEPVASPADQGFLQTEDSVFLNRVNFELLTRIRGGASEESDPAVDDLLNEFSEQSQVIQHAMQILLRVERQYDPLIWRTILAVARNEQTNDFYEQLTEGQQNDQSTREVIVEIGASFGLEPELVSAWSDFEE